MIPVTLNVAEVRWASEVAVARVTSTKARNPRFPYDDRTAHATHWLGCRGELAFAKALGLTWQAKVDTWNTSDIDPFWEVRTSPNPMVVKVSTRDAPGACVVQVVEKGHTRFEVTGYILASWAFAHVRLTDPNNRGVPAHFVDRHRLSPIDPGYHDSCHYTHEPEPVGWVCFICGKPFKEAAA